MLSLVVAHDTKYGIGKSNSLPWKLKKKLDILNGSLLNHLRDFLKLMTV